MIIELGGWSCGSLPILLSQSGYGTQVVYGREAALGVLEQASPALLIVGGAANPGLYRAARHASSAPILALVPREDEAGALSAFETGVDQYQVGPISSSEVAARAHAMLRRATWPAPVPPEESTE